MGCILQQAIVLFNYTHKSIFCLLGLETELYRLGVGTSDRGAVLGSSWMSRNTSINENC
jgi:hypothetical protein